MPPTENDFPLWRVRCRVSFRVIASSDHDTHEHAQVGVEEEAVFFLLQKAEPPHELRSAFTRGSVRGWVYLETSMKEHLVRLLMRTPGIIHTRQTGVVRQPIDFQDWTKMLMMQDGKLQPAIGQWVRVRKGTYKGDVGVVGGVENWSGVRLLLLPRQPPPRSSTSLKRKCSQSRPEAALFDPITASRVYQIDPLKQDDDVYLFRGKMFDHGLILLPFDTHSVSSAFVQMSSSTFFSFQQSRHPVVLSSSPPCPSDWNVTIGERVLIPSSGKRGVVSTTHEVSVEVDLATGGGIINVPWFDLRKDVKVGDFVEIEGGSSRGQAGWVQAVEGPVVHIVEQLGLRESQKSSSPNLIKVSGLSSPAAVYVNLLAGEPSARELFENY